KGDEGWLFRVYALSVLASAFPAVLVLMFVRDYLNLEASFPVFMMSYVFAGLAFMPLWKKLGQKLGLQTAWMISMLLGIVAFVGVVFLGEGDLLAFMLICIATGAVFGADVVLPQTLVALRVDADAQSRSQASGQFAFLSFLGKFALAVATGSALVMLHFGGFTPDGQNTQQSLFVLLCLYAFVPCVLKLLAFFSLLSAKPIFSKVSE
ncbi:MAG: MFS transporter, partial [Alphaproteobacteria bacterium]